MLFFVIVLGSWLFQRFILKLLLNGLASYYQKRQRTFKKDIVHQVEKPIRNLFFTTGFLIACGYAFNVSLWTFSPLMKILKTFLIFFFFKGVYNVTSYFGDNPDTLKNNFNLKTENVFFPFLSRIVKVLICIVAFAMIAYEWGYNMNGLVAGLGIGGLAIALGAKDALSHIFAGFSIAVDKPFNIGDLISSSNGLEGVVEDMNFRSTKIRTLDKALVSVPNAVIANEHIYNWTRRQNRRVRFLLGVTYSTNEDQLKTVTERIKEFIHLHSGVEEDTTTVAFDSYAPNSLDILIQYVTNTSDYNNFIKIKEEINYQIMTILKEEKVSIAFPSQSVYFNNPLMLKQESSTKQKQTL